MDGGGGGGANTPEQWYYNLPIVTRVGLTIFFSTTLLFQMGVLDPSLIILHWPMIYQKLQLWRLFTGSFFLGKFSFNLVFQLYFFTSFGSKLERNEIFTNEPGGYVFFMLFQMIVISLLGLVLQWPTGIPMVGPSLIFSVIYYWSRREPYAQLSFFSFNIKGFQFPFALLFFQMLMGGSPWMDLLGLASGHIFYFLKEIVPQEYGKSWLVPPVFLQTFAVKHLGAVPPQGGVRPQQNFGGAGQRLGG